MKRSRQSNSFYEAPSAEVFRLQNNSLLQTYSIETGELEGDGIDFE